MLNHMKKCLFIILGTLSLLLGFVGILLPLLPTTPFLLLSSVCYLRGSKRAYRWLMTRKVIGTYLYNYLTYKAIPKSKKVAAIILLWATLFLSIMLIDHWPVRILLILVGIGVSIHLFSLKTIKESELIDPNINACEAAQTMQGEL